MSDDMLAPGDNQPVGNTMAEDDYAKKVGELAAGVMCDPDLSKAQKKSKLAQLVDLLDDAEDGMESYRRRTARRKVGMQYNLMEGDRRHSLHTNEGLLEHINHARYHH